MSLVDDSGGFVGDLRILDDLSVSEENDEF